jgi:hypothetical protein
MVRELLFEGSSLFEIIQMTFAYIFGRGHAPAFVN